MQCYCLHHHFVNVSVLLNYVISEVVASSNVTLSVKLFKFFYWKKMIGPNLVITVIGYVQY